MPTTDAHDADTETRKLPVKLLALLGVGVLGLVIVYWPASGPPPRDLPPRYPTKGTLTYNGKPAKGAIVTLWPLPLASNTWRTVKPQAMVEADGSFQPNSYDLKDGAVKGDYVVTVLWTGESGGPGPDLLKGRFADPAKPVLKVTIKEGENAVPPLTLTGPPIDAASAGGADGDGGPPRPKGAAKK